MLSSFSVLFAVLIAVPGLLIPLHIGARMLRVLGDGRRTGAERAFAGGTVVAMLLLMALSTYAALEAYSRLNALAAMAP